MLGLDLSFRFDPWIDALPGSPKDLGRVHLCVLRPAGSARGCRETPASVELAPGRGVLGDRWETDEHHREGNQVSLMNLHVIRAIAGDEERLPLVGDNFLVDLDLSEANLPPGTELELGEALLRVSAEPHRPCRSFSERFGVGATKRIARANRRGLRGRGVLCSIVRGGLVRPGDEIRVRRPAPGGGQNLKRS